MNWSAVLPSSTASFRFLHPHLFGSTSLLRRTFFIMVNIIARAFGVCAVVLAFGSNAVLAAPTQAQAQGNCIATLPGNFTLTALNTTLPNANATGIPLIIANVQTDHTTRSYQVAVRHRAHFAFTRTRALAHRAICSRHEALGRTVTSSPTSLSRTTVSGRRDQLTTRSAMH
jgi:hypothetical protein